MPQRPVVSASTLHEMPVPVGSGSLRSTPFRVPAPVLLSQIVKPMLSPALTLAASAFFTIVRSGQRTVVLALALTLAWLVALAVATFGYSPPRRTAVLDVTCTTRLAPLTRSP